MIARRFSRWFTGTALSSVALTLAAPVMAQDLEEIVVTARKREESLLEVPISITAFTSETIQELGISNIDDLARFTPGVSFVTYAGRQPGSQRPSVRGITTILQGVGNSSAAASFIDGIYVGGTTSVTELTNLERVEILKGPQSAQYGRGTYAGAINYVTRKPTDEFEGQVDITAAEHDTFKGSAWVSGPIVEDNLYFFLGAAYDEYGGEYDNIKDGGKAGGEETKSVTAKLLFNPNDNLDITLKLGRQEADDDTFVQGLQSRALNNCSFRGAGGGSGLFEPTGISRGSLGPAEGVGIGPRAREYYCGTAVPQDFVSVDTKIFDPFGGAGTFLERELASLAVNYEFNNGYSLFANLGSIKDETKLHTDVSWNGTVWFPQSFLFFLNSISKRLLWTEQEDLSGELRISSPADRPFRWTAGLYYYEGDFDDIRTDKVFADNDFGFCCQPGTTAQNGALATDDVENQAVFAGVEWDINDRLTATAELRWSEDDIVVTTYQNLGDAVRGPITGQFTDTFDSVTPRVTLSYKLTDESNIYLNISNGTKPGDFNSQVPIDPATGQPDESLRSVDEEEVWSYEVGYKASILGGRGNLALAGYYSDVTDQQLTQVIELTPGGNTVSLIQNVGATEVLGFEIELAALVTDNLTLGVTYGYTDSEIQEFINSDQADLLGGNGTFADIQRLGSVAGNKTPRVPESMASLVLNYEREWSAGNMWYVTGDMTYEGSRFAQVHNLIETGDRTYFGLRFGLRGERWDASIWGKNLTDDDTVLDVTRYIDRSFGGFPGGGPESCAGLDPTANCAGVSSSPRGFGIALPRGRQLGATFSYRF